LQHGDVTVEASQQEKQLYNLLLHGYSKQTRPVRRVGDPVRVRVALSLVEVLGIDENNGQISVKAWLTMVSESLSCI
jgi:Neurotransmitter-gated ion-channel ligand binding domain